MSTRIVFKTKEEQAIEEGILDFFKRSGNRRKPKGTMPPPDPTIGKNFDELNINAVMHKCYQNLKNLYLEAKKINPNLRLINSFDEQNKPYVKKDLISYYNTLEKMYTHLTNNKVEQGSAVGLDQMLLRTSDKILRDFKDRNQKQREKIDEIPDQKLKKLLEEVGLTINKNQLDVINKTMSGLRNNIVIGPLLADTDKATEQVIVSKNDEYFTSIAEQSRKIIDSNIEGVINNKNFDDFTNKRQLAVALDIYFSSFIKYIKIRDMVLKLSENPSWVNNIKGVQLELPNVSNPQQQQTQADSNKIAQALKANQQAQADSDSARRDKIIKALRQQAQEKPKGLKEVYEGLFNKFLNTQRETPKDPLFTVVDGKKIILND